MNNRLAVGLAVGAGYVLGRTKKAKLAFGIGTMVLGKRLKLSPGALAQFAAGQLENNPQFKEIGDQLRQDLRGVGKAATGAMVNRRLEGLADRLHDRTLDVQDRMSGVAKEGTDKAEEASAPARKTADRAKRSAPAKKAQSAAKKSEPARRAVGAKKTAARRTSGSKTRSSERAETKEGRDRE